MFLHDIRINYTLFRRGGQLFSQNLQIMGTKPGAADVWVRRAAVTPHPHIRRARFLRVAGGRMTTGRFWLIWIFKYAPKYRIAILRFDSYFVFRYQPGFEEFAALFGWQIVVHLASVRIWNRAVGGVDAEGQFFWIAQAF